MSTELWDWFSLSRASFLVLPRVLMHEMPEEWQDNMVKLLDEYDETFTNQPNIGTTVRITKNGKVIKTPEWLVNYRHPDRHKIEELKQPF